jgi:hypothetical protein
MIICMAGQGRQVPVFGTFPGNYVKRRKTGKTGNPEINGKFGGFMDIRISP